jgi:hypothetical protein
MRKLLGDLAPCGGHCSTPLVCAKIDSKSDDGTMIGKIRERSSVKYAAFSVVFTNSTSQYGILIKLNHIVPVRGLLKIQLYNLQLS